jgi:hypothetical protein
MASGNDKLAQNQDMARRANERLQDVAGRTAEEGKVIPFLCECADDACLGRVEISIDDYFIAHLDANHYVVMPGHPRVDGEALVADRGHYQLVSKTAA